MLEVETIEGRPQDIRSSGATRMVPFCWSTRARPRTMNAQGDQPGPWGEAVDDDRCTTAGPDVSGSYGSGYVPTPENHLLGVLLR